MSEGQRLQRITRTAKDPVKLRRAIVVLMSAQGQPAADIAYLLKATDDYVRDVIHAFNDRGFDALNPKWRGGTPNKISRDRRLHPMAQPASPTENRIRDRLQDPPPGLPLQSRMTRH